MKIFEPLNRRRFLKTGTRYAMLASLGGLAVAGEAKRRRLENDPNCIRLWTCADCAEFGGCTKPKAATARRNSEEPLPPRDLPAKTQATRSLQMDFSKNESG